MSEQVRQLERRIAQYIATLTYQHLIRSNLVRADVAQDEPILWVWTLADRCVIVVNPLRVRNVDAFVKPRFTHHLGTVLQGRRVVVTNHRGVFVQVAYYPEPARELVSKPLDLSAQPHALAVPIGMTARGALWLGLAELDAVLIGGARRMGKTNLLHTWIAALLQGAQVRLILFDGKGGAEFARYRGAPRVQVVDAALAPALGELYAEMTTRFDALKTARAASIAEYNAGRGEGARWERIALVVDELAYALNEDGVEGVLVDLTARGGAVGVHPILATQRPAADVVTPKLKGNLVTRIALPVPDRASSMVVLDRAGAESIAKTPGRLLIAHNARIIEAQAFYQVEKAKGKSDDAPMLACSRMSERERRVARAAIERGRFVIREIAEATGETLEYVNDLAKKWQVLGYVSEVKRNAQGHRVGREILPALGALLGEQGEHPNKANKAELGTN